MGVSLPSDLIVDVMRNADPARLNVAMAKLRDVGGSQSGPNAFAGLLGDLDMATAHAGSIAGIEKLQGKTLGPPVHAGVTPGTYVEFERMVLRNLFESLLPDAESGAFGTGPSAGVWRSLASDQLASLYADTGGIGIASALAAADDRRGDVDQAQWPYFNAGKIEAYTG